MDITTSRRDKAGVERFDDYQATAITTAVYPAGSLAYLALGLNGEAGEVAEIIKRQIRGGKPLESQEIERLAMELGDCLWYIANAARELGFNLSVIAEKNLEKLRDRKLRGVIHGRGDNR